MGQIRGRWIEDNGVDNRVLDNTDEYTIAGLTNTGNLQIDGTSIFINDVRIDSKTDITGNLTVLGDSSLQGLVTFGSGISLTGDSSLTGNLYVSGDSSLQGPVDMGSGLTVSGDSSLLSNLSVSGNSSLNTAETSGLLTINDDATVTGNLRVDGTVSIGGSTISIDGMNIGGTGSIHISATDTTISNPLKVDNQTVIMGNLGIGTIPSSTLTVQGDVYSSGDATIIGNMKVDGTPYWSGDTTTQGNSSIAGNLYVDGTAYIGGSTAVIDGTGLSVGSILSSSGTFNGNVTLQPPSGTGYLLMQADPPYIQMTDSGGASDDKKLVIKTDGGVGKIYSLNDNDTVRVDKILVTDMENGRVGVGTDIPNSELHTHHDGHACYNRMSAYYVTNDATYHTAVGVESFEEPEVRYSNYIGGGNTRSTFWVDSGSGVRKRFSIHANGRLASGIDSPDTDLHLGPYDLSWSGTNVVATLQNKNTEISLTSSNGSSLYLGKMGVLNDGTFNIGSVSNKPLNFYTNDLSRIFVSNSGDVGLGTTGPLAKLDIRSNSAVTTHLLLVDTQIYSTPPFEVIGFYGEYRDTGLKTTFSLIQGGKENTTNNDSDGYLSFQTRKSGAALLERVRINSDGNVGIGTINPGHTLEIIGNQGVYVTSGSTYIENNLKGDNQTGYATIYSQSLASGGSNLSYAQLKTFGGSASGTTFGINRANASFVILNSASDASCAIGTDSNSSLIIGTNDTERMRITNVGNVGIGTINPLKRLHITASDEDLVRLERTGASARQWDINIRPAFVIGDNSAGQDRLTIDTTGRVGLGTTPSTPLHVYRGTGNDTYLKLTYGSNDFLLGIETDGHARVENTVSTGNLYLKTNSGYVVSNSSVGIGTTYFTPTARLDVRENQNSDNVVTAVFENANRQDGDRNSIIVRQRDYWGVNKDLYLMLDGSSLGNERVYVGYDNPFAGNGAYIGLGPGSGDSTEAIIQATDFLLGDNDSFFVGLTGTIGTVSAKTVDFDMGSSSNGGYIEVTVSGVYAGNTAKTNSRIYGGSFWLQNNALADNNTTTLHSDGGEVADLTISFSAPGSNRLRVSINNISFAETFAGVYRVEFKTMNNGRVTRY